MNIKLLFIPLLLFSSELYAETIHLGILNTSGNEAENVLYAETASVLKDKLKPRNVEVSTYDLPGLEKAIAAGKLDFFISNPGFYVSSRQKLDTTALASQSNQFFVRPDRALGSVFVVPKQNSNIFSLRDLRGKSVCAVAPNAYGGLYIALGELNRRGFDPDKFFSSVHYSGYPMPKVLEELKAGKCEAAIVRTCLLEELSASGQIKENEFRVIEPRPSGSKEHCIRSTELYPGWVFAATKNTSETLRKETTKILFSLPAVQGNEWSVPRNFADLDNLYKNLKVGHYEYLRNWDWKEFIRNYWSFILIVFVVMIAVFLHNLILKQQVERRTERLRQTMKEKLAEHQAAVNANRHLHDMEKINLVGMLSSMIAHELRQPLTVIRNYAEGLKEIAHSPDYDTKVLDEALKVVDEQSIRASSIIEHMRGLIKGKESKVRDVDLNSFVPTVIDTYKELGGKYEIKFVTSAATPTTVQIDPTQFEIVLLNLLNNASEAITQQETKPVITVGISCENGEAAVSVRNEGFLEHKEAFDNLFAVKSSTKANGLGLGLAIAARVIERWGGQLSIHQHNKEVIACILLPSQ
ncbi:sensor histidine kinase [Parasutterella sp.]|jgi:two-component system, LuxR family, sensor histidine kinase TtrS|uniref:sensor histidine kinase n=1 Tax=Parasutterella sp. TaxID=2049037 RepID=UPI003AB6BB3A